MIRSAIRLASHVVRCVNEESKVGARQRDGLALWDDFDRTGSQREAVRQMLIEECGHFLSDIEWRYAQARELLSEAGAPAVASGRRITAEDMDTQSHVLTGYAITNNSPGAGSIAWAALHIVYQGVDYTIADGNTALKYSWFIKPATGTTATLTSSNTKPTLGKDDVLVFINNGGTAVVASGTASASLPGVVADGAVDFGAIAAGAVTGDRIANGGIGTGKLGTGAISAATMFGGGVVDNAAIGTGAVNSDELAGSAVTAGKVAAGALNNSNVFTTGVVNGTAIGSAAISPTKLNTLTHELY